MITPTGQVQGDSLKTVNWDGDGFADSSRSHEKSFLPLFAGGAAFCVSSRLVNLVAPDFPNRNSR
jgi:hypothetical protein